MFCATEHELPQNCPNFTVADVVAGGSQGEAWPRNSYKSLVMFAFSPSPTRPPRGILGPEIQISQILGFSRFF